MSLLLGLITVATYFPVVYNSFVSYDDKEYILQVPQIQQAFGWRLIRWAFTAFVASNWHPLTWLSHAIDYQLFQSSPWAVHLENVFLHAASSVLLFWVLLYPTGKTWRSLMVAALFALHPLNVESVAWGAERKNVLSVLFFMLTLLAYEGYAARRTIGRYLAVVAAFALGLMAKPQIVTLPFVLLLWDVWPLRRRHNSPGPKSEETLSWPRLLAEKIPLFLLALASCMITVRAQAAGGAIGSLAKYPVSFRLQNAIVAYAQYIGTTFAPFRLAVFYPLVTPSIARWKMIAALAILTGVTTAVIVLRKRTYLGVGWFWFVGTLVPMIGLVQVGLAARADRYMYLSAIGLFLAVVWGVADVAEEHFIPRGWVTATASMVLIALAVLTWRQVGYWRDSRSLWEHALEVTDNNTVAAIELGRYLDAEQDWKGAIVQYRNAIRFTSDPEQLATAYTDLGIDLNATGDTAEALDSYNSALGLNPKMFNAYYDRGLLFEKQGNIARAVQDYEHSVLLQPSVQGYLQLSHALRQLNRIGEAQAYYAKAVQLASSLQSAQ